MFTNSELYLLHFINNDCNTAKQLKEKTGFSQAQVYNILRHLRDKSILSDSKKISISNNAFAIRLHVMLCDYPKLSEVLSDNGIDILIEFMQRKKAEDVANKLNLSRSTVFRKITVSKSMGVLVHDGTEYYLNEKLWPNMTELLRSVIDLRSVYDCRIPKEGKVIINNREYVIYSSKFKTQDHITAFSFFENEGLPITTDSYYYSTRSVDDLNTAFCDAFDITKRLGDHRLRMGLLIEYVSNKSKINAPDEFTTIWAEISKGKKINGWPTIDEVKLRMEGWE